MDIKIVTPSGESVGPSKIDSQKPEQIEGPVTPQLEINAMAQVMGLDGDEAEKNRSMEKLETLLEYAKSKTKDHSPENLKWIIRSLELKLGTPPFAEKRINWISRYAYLNMEKRKLDSEIKSFEQI